MPTAPSLSLCNLAYSVPDAAKGARERNEIIYAREYDTPTTVGGDG